MKKLLLTLTIIGSAFTVLTANAVQWGDKLLLTAKLTGSQEVPAVSTNALGVGSFLLNAAHDSLCVNVTFTGLTTAVTGAHIHIGEIGVSGPVIKDLSTIVSGNSIKTVITGADLSTHLKEYLAGQLYINVHTNAHPDGEIRGQILLETDWTFVSNLDASQIVPPTTATANGLGVFCVSQDSSKIKFTIVTQGASGAITEARLNYGAFGKNGKSALNLTSYISGNSITGVINDTTGALIDSLFASKIYLDLSTTLHPSGGELRGQLIHERRYLYFDANINGQEEVPIITTTAKGVAVLKLNTTFDTLWYDIVANGLTGAITGANLHVGNPGSTGNIELNIVGGLVGNRITGKVTGSALTKNLTNKLFKGQLYINLQTLANGTGEIRGQIYRAARQGYALNLTGTQENPPVSTLAHGSGIVSIGKDTSVHFMILVNGLQATGINFHNQIAGQNGNAIFNLKPYYSNNGAFGYWKITDSVPFTTNIANGFYKDSIYTNVTTAANPNGEIRGQFTKNGECYKDSETGIKENKHTLNGISLYPNPSADVLNISFNSSLQSKVNVAVIDVLGKQVYTENYTAQNGNNLHTITVTNLKSGFYFVRIQNENGQAVERFIKK
jgi:hypothetical protein